MKRSLLLLLSLFVGNQLSAQHIVSTGTTRNILLEASVSANQFFTPTAYCVQDNMRSNNRVIIVNHHSTTAFTDPMSVTNDYDLWEDIYITTYPSGMVNRVPYNSHLAMSRTFWTDAVTAEMATSAQYLLTMSVTRAGRDLSISLQGKTAVSLTGEYRFNVLILEDSVMHDQASNSTQLGSCSYLTGANVLPNFQHRDVLRAALGGSFGQYKTTNPMAGQVDVMNFNYTVPSGYNMQRIKVVGVVQKYSNDFSDRPIMNAVVSKLSCIADVGTITGPSAVCVGSSANVSNTVSGGTWASLRGKFTIDATGKVTANATGKDSIIYMVPNTCNAIPDTAYKLITIDASSITAQPADIAGTEGETKQFSVTSSSAVAYKWQADAGSGYTDLTNSGQFSGTNAATLTISNITTANNNQKFRCVVTDANCTATSDEAILYVFPTGIANIVSDHISIAPNPAASVVRINATTEINKIEIMNLLGQKVFGSSYNTKDVSIDVSGLNAGVYFIRVNDSYTQKLVKE